MRNNWGTRIKNCKKRGEWVELVFAARAMWEGLRLARPWGEWSGDDFVVDQERGRRVRVQVKSTMFKEGTGYSCTMKDSKGPYKKNSFEYVAAYVIPENVWFIIPEKKVRGKWSVGLYPKLERSKYGEYKEAWDLLRGKLPEVIGRIEACAEEDVFLSEMRATRPRAHAVRWRDVPGVARAGPGAIQASSGTLRRPARP